MNITGRPVYQKQHKSKPRTYTAIEKAHCDKVRSLPCIISNDECRGRITIHHTGTSRGGRKNHMKVLPLCWEHHQGELGIDGKIISKPEWQERYGTEEQLLELVEQWLSSL